MTDAERYAIAVRKVLVDDQEMWRATVRELPDLAEFAETREEALDLALDAIESLKVAAAEEGRPFPEPIEDEEEYSGRVTLRMPKSLHRTVALKALQDEVSINSFIVTKLALCIGDAPQERQPQVDWSAITDQSNWLTLLNSFCGASAPLTNASTILYGPNVGVYRQQGAVTQLEAYGTAGALIQVNVEAGEQTPYVTYGTKAQARYGELRQRRRA